MVDDLNRQRTAHIVAMLQEGRAVEAEALCRRYGADRPGFLGWHLVEWALGRDPLTVNAKERAAAVYGMAVPVTELAPVPETASFPAVVLFAMPKSGSTYLSRILQRALDWPEAEANPVNDLSAVGYDAAMMLTALSHAAIARSHAAASVRVRAMLRATGRTPTILVRDVFDAMESMVDHWARRDFAAVGLPMAYADWPRDDQREAILARFACYYVDFYASWAHCAAEVGAEIIEYEQLRVAPAQAARIVLGAAGRSGVSADRIDAAVREVDRQRRDDPASVRFNQGIDGRGRSFSEEQCRRVRALYRQYPKIDFSRIDQGWKPN